MNFGAHLPLIGFEGAPYSLDTLLEYTRTAESLSYSTLAANDHLVFQLPWIDGPTALAAVLSATQGMDPCNNGFLACRTRPGGIGQVVGSDRRAFRRASVGRDRPRVHRRGTMKR